MSNVSVVLPPEVSGLMVSAAELLAIGDPGRTRTVLASIAFLIAIGVGLLVLAGWLVRSTRVDPELLAPLEMMGERSWRAADPVWQRRRLDEVRPVGAEPLERMAPPPAADPEFEAGPPLGDFSDFDDLLRDLGVDIEPVASGERAPELADQPPDPTVVEVSPGSLEAEADEADVQDATDRPGASGVADAADADDADDGPDVTAADDGPDEEVDAGDPEAVDQAADDQDPGDSEPDTDRDAVRAHGYDA